MPGVQAAFESRETIFALSSGRPPAAIAVVRISGPGASEALQRLSNVSPEPRRARTADIRDPATGELLDRALLLWMPGPNSATGEDVAELHLHGGRAVVDGVLDALSCIARLRAAAPGEFTRRAFENGRLDLNEAEGLADLLEAETRSQRRAALSAAGGALSRRVEEWRVRLLEIAAGLEALIDFDDDGDVDPAQADAAFAAASGLADDIAAMLAQPPAERLKEGVRVVFAGPPNSGKSTLVNALAGRDVAIASPIAGTTRDVIEAPLTIDGVPFVFIDTAGLRHAAEEIEAAGVARAGREIAGADIVIWLGAEEPPLTGALIAVFPKSDLHPPTPGRLPISAATGQGLDILISQIVSTARTLLPVEGDVSFNRRQRTLAGAILDCLRALADKCDHVVAAEECRAALGLCDQLTGRAGVENMLDALFGRFCLGK